MSDVSRCVLNDHLADRRHTGHRKARVWETVAIILTIGWCLDILEVVEGVRSLQFPRVGRCSLQDC